MASEIKEIIRLDEEDEPPPWANMTDQEIMDSINEAYADFPDEEEKALLEFGRRQMAQLLADDKW